LVRGLADLAARISALDRAAALSMEQTDSLALDRVMPTLSRLADHNLLDRAGARPAGVG